MQKDLQCVYVHAEKTVSYYIFQIINGYIRLSVDFVICEYLIFQSSLKSLDQLNAKCTQNNIM
jgi:hypothetical protein